MDPLNVNHFNYSHAHPQWYEPWGRYKASDELLAVARSIVPNNWSFGRSGVWMNLNPPQGQLPDQGWKIHVSATMQNCTEILRRAALVCVQQGVPFKYLVDTWVVFMSTGKGWSRGSSGKFMTIYPRHEEQFRDLLELLYEPLRDFEGPYVLSDRRYKDAKVLYYRYGGIKAIVKPTAMGTESYMIYTPDGEMVPDERTPYWNPPAWVTDPFPPAESTGDGSPLLGNGRYQVERALAFSVTGGVYAATDLDTGRTVAIKEARPYTGVDRNGDSATDRLQKEFRLLRKLSGTRAVPEALDLFTEWEHLFLVEEYIPGMNLATYTVSASPLTRGQGLHKSQEYDTGVLLRIWLSITKALAAVHDRDIVFGDMSLRNVMLLSQDTGEVRLIDLEGAWEPGVDKPAPWFGTPGFSPSAGVRSKRDDIYGLGATMLSTMLPINALSMMDPTATDRFIPEVIKDLGMSSEIERLIRACLSPVEEQRPTLAQITEVLTRER